MSIWTTAVGAWGDVLASYGNIKKLLRERNEEKANVVYFGLDANINKFLMAQDDIDKVSHLLISEPSQYSKYAYMATRDFDQFKAETELIQQLPNIIPTHITRYYQVDNPTDCNRFTGCNLPPCESNWHEFLQDKTPYILVQPYSVQSCPMQYHWPHWVTMIEQLIEQCAIAGCHIVLTGQLANEADPKFHFPWFEGSSLVNLVGQTRTMVDVFHIANNAAGIITTSNCLAMWSIVQQKPAIVINNRIVQERPLYYKNWITSEPNTVLPWETPLVEFEEHFNRLGWLRQTTV